MSTKKVTLTDNQLDAFNKLWWVFGNNGRKCTLFNHKLVQGFLQYGEDRRDDYLQGRINMADKFGQQYADKNGVTQECVDACTEILNNP